MALAAQGKEGYQPELASLDGQTGGHRDRADVRHRQTAQPA